MTHRFLDTFRSPAALARFVLVAAVGLSLDLWTKWLAFHTLLVSLLHYPDNTFAATSRSYDFIPGWIRFEVTVNQGAVFGIGQGQRLLFLIVSSCRRCIPGLSFPCQQTPAVVLPDRSRHAPGRRARQRLRPACVRIRSGHDPRAAQLAQPAARFFPNWQYIFPWIFNVADSLLCVGVALMLLYTLFSPARHPVPDVPQSEPPDRHAESQRA